MASTRVVRLIATLLATGLVAGITSAPSAAAPAADVSASHAAAKASAKFPPKPRLPRDFHGRGRYIVRDIGANVPFKWKGRNGNSIMVAGGKDEKIYYKNIVFGNTIYTITYEWPGLKDHEKGICVPFKGLDRGWLNGTLLKTSRYVGREILQGKTRRFVHHWRAGIVFLQDLQPKPGNPKFPRFPVMIADVYVGQENNRRWWQLLQFGVQNQLDPSLDEYVKMNTFKLRPGRVRLPAECRQVSPPTQTLDQLLRQLLKDLFEGLKL